MKKTCMLWVLLTGMAAFAQNEDIIEKTTTVKTIVKTNKGEEIDVIKEVTSEKEALKVENNNRTNQTVTRRPLVKKSTTFSVDNSKFSIQPDKNGYVMLKVNDDGEEMFGKIRKMPDKDFYILNTENKDFFGYFDKDGNFVVESYDKNSDGVIVKKYVIEK